MHSDVLLSVSGAHKLTAQCFNLRRDPHRNKHIMIDLGTGNNNKMYVPTLDLCRLFSHSCVALVQ